MTEHEDLDHGPMYCMGHNCGTTTAQHSPECILETAITQGWSTEATLAAAKAVFDARPTLSPAHIKDGEEVEVVGTLIIGEQGWDNAIELNPGPVMALADANPKSAMPLMTVAQHQRIVAALSAPPAAGVPEVWREDVSLAAQMLTWGDDDGGLTERQIREIEQHAKKLFAMLAAPTPPASEQQRAVVMVEPVEIEREKSQPNSWDDHGMGWNACVAEFLRLNPHLATPPQENDR